MAVSAGRQRVSPSGPLPGTRKCDRKRNDMTFEEFNRSITESHRPPGGIADPLTSLWWDRKGDWHRAHAIAQTIPTVQGSAVHAYLHREEGVLWNADYWYRRAGRKRPEISLEAEWEALVHEMLAVAP